MAHQLQGIDEFYSKVVVVNLLKNYLCVSNIAGKLCCISVI